jgi:hypothetical protein
LRYDSKQLIDRAYELYRSREQSHTPEGSESKNFRDSFSYKDPIIKFLGLWDTVGAHGIPSFTFGKGFEYLKLHDLNVSGIVKNAYQILGIHENLSFLEPCPIYREIKDSKDSKTELVTEEIWFPGAHLEIGGGIYSTNRDISWESYLWMIEKIIKTGGLLSEKPERKKLNAFKQLKQKLYSSTVYYSLRFVAFWSITHRDRTIPLFKDDKVLTFDMLYEKGDWNFKKFKNISDTISDAKRKKNSLTYFCDAMEDILVEELCRANNEDGHSNGEEKDSDINKAKIHQLFEEINSNKKGTSHIKFDPKIISKFNTDENIEEIIKKVNIRKGDLQDNDKHKTRLLC